MHPVMISMITIYQGQDFDTHIKKIKAEKYLNLEGEIEVNHNKTDE